MSLQGKFVVVKILTKEERHVYRLRKRKGKGCLFVFESGHVKNSTLPTYVRDKGLFLFSVSQ